MSKIGLTGENTICEWEFQMTVIEVGFRMYIGPTIWLMSVSIEIQLFRIASHFLGFKMNQLVNSISRNYCHYY
jgi:hypothetical protein